MSAEEAAEAGYLPHEVVCPVSNLTYHKGLPRSPYIDEDGQLAF